MPVTDCQGSCPCIKVSPLPQPGLTAIKPHDKNQQLGSNELQSKTVQEAWLVVRLAYNLSCDLTDQII